MQFKVLGPLEVADDGRTLPLGGPKQKLVLALLLLRANQLVDAAQLIDEIWGDEPPDGARGTLQSYVSHLRKAVGPARIEGRSAGYVLHVDADELDATAFERLVRDARAEVERNPAAAADTLEEALALWSGRALSDLADEPALRPDITRLEELRSAALEERFSAGLALGLHGELIAELHRAIERQPLREPLRGLLMLALYRAGRQAEALEAYQRARDVLGDELGIDPSPELQRLHERILRQDPDLEIGGVPLRGYRLMSQVGEGALGTVHRAIQPHVGREVAVKAIRSRIANDPEFIRRFEEDAQRVAGLEHPHVVPIYDYWREPDGAYVVMRFMRGGSLADLLAGGAPDPATATRTVEQIASALAAAHRRGLVHGDVKPSNILYDEDRNAYLSDFAMANGAVAPDADLLALDVVAASIGAPAPAPAPAPARDVPNPYKGLRPFLEADAADFFGREALVERLVARMKDSRLVAVVGPSGSGKSSVVRAGLVPALRRGAIAGSEKWFPVVMVPGDHPFEALERTLLRIASSVPGGLLETLERDEAGLLDAANRILPADGSELVLVVDQFEELFTLVTNENTRRAFLALLTAAVKEIGSRVRVVLTLRADYYDRPLSHRGFGDVLAVRHEAVTPLTTAELERALTGPAERLGVAVEPLLLAEAVSDVVDQAGSLPLLQYALTELFELREGGALTLDAYRAIGGVSGALVRRAEDLYTELDDRGREACRNMFLRLTGAGTDARRRALRAELTSLELDRDAMERVIDTFGRHRLLSFDRDPVSRGPTVEVAHEALLREWSRLREWLEDAREDLEVQRRLTAAAGEWASNARDRSFLWSGARLGHVEGWTTGSTIALSETERAFISESLTRRDSERAEEEARAQRERTLERRSLRRMRALVAVLAVAATLAASLSVIALGQRARARDQLTIATARELASSALANLGVDPERSILLALEAVRTYRSGGLEVGRDAIEVLHQAVQGSRIERTLHDDSTGNVAFSPAGDLIATGGSILGAQQPEVVVWDAKTGEKIKTFTGHTADISDVAFSPDGTLLASGVDDGLVFLWDLRSGTSRSVLVPPDIATALAFTPDGRRLVAATLKGLAIWNVNTSALERTLPDPDGIGYTGLSLSPDGAKAAVGSYTGSDAFVWDLATDRRILRLRTGSSIFAVSWSPDGRRIATGGNDGVARTFDAKTGAPQLTLRGQAGWLFGVAYRPDGRAIATAGTDGTARLWDAETGDALLTLSGHRGQIGDLAFSPDGTRLLTGAGDSTARIWNVTQEGGREAFTLAPGGRVRSVSYSLDGKRLITVAGDARIWDAATGAEVVRVESPGPLRDGVFSSDSRSVALLGAAPVLADATSGGVLTRFEGLNSPFPFERIAMSADRRLVAGASADGSFTVWDASTGKALRTVRQNDWPALEGVVTSVAFSPDGSQIATGSWDGTAKLWNAESSLENQQITPHHTFRVTSVTFAPDGAAVLTGGADGQVSLWRLGDGRNLRTLVGHTGVVLDATMSRDGRLVASSGDDGTTRIWDLRTGRELLKLVGRGSAVNRVSFSPDARRVVTASDDGTARVYLLRLDDLLRVARERVTRGLTPEECRLYLHVDRCP